MHTITICQKRDHEFEEDGEGEYLTVWKEKGGEKNAVIKL